MLKCPTDSRDAELPITSALWNTALSLKASEGSFPRLQIVVSKPVHFIKNLA